MARMYSRARGKAGSKKPIKKTTPAWVRYKPKEIELLIVKLAKEGLKPSQIGMHLRDSYGIPDVHTITRKSITGILKEKHALDELPEDLLALIKKVIFIKKHLEQNKQDMTAKRGLTITESKISKLVKYYKNTGKLPKTWKYDPSKVRLSIE
ncbi:MAG: 30S ribosomal protein S15 [archaeon]